MSEADNEAMKEKLRKLQEGKLPLSDDETVDVLRETGMSEPLGDEAERLGAMQERFAKWSKLDDPGAPLE